MTTTTAGAIAVVGAVSALLLALPAPRAWPTAGPRPRPLGGLRGVVVATLGVTVALLTLPLAGRALALTVIGLLVVLGAQRLIAARRARREADATTERVLEACGVLAADLTAGQPPGAALDRAAEGWDALVPVAQTQRMGGDVPRALRAVGERPGAAGLRVVGASWQVAHGTGGGLAEAVDRVARDLRAARSTRRVVDGELASARATARLVAALPLVALLMGSGTGGDPWGFLVQPLGLACLGAGLALGLAGLWWIEGIARGVTAES